MTTTTVHHHQLDHHHRPPPPPQVAKEAGTSIGKGKKKPGRETRRRVNARRWIATSGEDDLQRKVRVVRAG